MLIGLLLTALASAACPADEPVLHTMACGDRVDGDLKAGVPSEWDWIYECGWPSRGLLEDGPEDLYEFTCPDVGEVMIELHDALCDMDLYVLDDDCSPRGPGCLAGDTRIVLYPLDATFLCEYPGQTRYIVVEGKGLADPTGLCTLPTGGEYVLKFNTVLGACDIEPLAVAGPPEPGIAGEANTFYVEGGTPGANFHVLAGTGLGDGIEVPGCPGVRLPITGHRLLGNQRINPGGYGTRTTVVPESAAGLRTWITIVELASCEVSEPYAFTWR